MLKALAKKVLRTAIYFLDGRGKEKSGSLELYGLCPLISLIR